MHPPGWYHAQGDPPDTNRYWDGSQWVGPATASDQRQTAGGYDLILPSESPTGQGDANLASQNVVVTRRPVRAPPTAKKKGVRRGERFAVRGFILVVLGLILGICGHNIATLFSTPTEIEGIVTEVDQVSGRRGRDSFRIEITTEVGQFYTSGRVRSFPAPVQNSLQSGGAQQRVIVSYSELTGGLIAVDGLGGHDRRIVGRILWPVIALGTLILALATIYYDFTLYRDRLLSLVLTFTYLVVGPLIGLIVFDALASIFTRIFDAPY